MGSKAILIRSFQLMKEKNEVNTRKHNAEGRRYPIMLKAEGVP